METARHWLVWVSYVYSGIELRCWFRWWSGWQAWPRDSYVYCFLFVCASGFQCSNGGSCACCSKCQRIARWTIASNFEWAIHVFFLRQRISHTLNKVYWTNVAPFYPQIYLKLYATICLICQWIASELWPFIQCSNGVFFMPVMAPFSPSFDRSFSAQYIRCTAD